MKCQKCNSNITKEDLFCPECGHKIQQEKYKVQEVNRLHKENKLSRYRWVFLIIGTLLVLGLILVFAVPMPYESKEGYTEKVPYTETETYYENEAYQGEECNEANVQYNIDKNVEWVDTNQIKVDCTITNFENQPIQFSFVAVSMDSDHIDIDGDGELINVGSQQTVTKSRILKAVPNGYYDCRIWVAPIQKCKTATKFRDVPKTRSITKYKDDYKERFVTKFATLFQQWSGQAKHY